jgi:glycine/D-amino acid oxidase-like deaminating enzyme/nitrite reductase/ring-hydroxylating ferredoxin subunit
MNAESGKSVSIWAATYDVPAFRKLDENIETDICIIGAGITGLLTACRLCLSGNKVVVLEDGQIGSGETARTTAHITNVIDDRFSEITRLHGEEACRLAAESQTAAIKLIEDLVTRYKIDCEFRHLDGYLFFRPEQDADALEDEYHAAIKAGIDVKILPGGPLEFASGYPCLMFPNQAEFHVLKFISAVAGIIESNSGKIYTDTHVKKINEEPEKVTLETSDGNIVTAQKVITCTNSPISDYVKIHLKEAAYRTYVVGLVIPKGSVPEGLYWDNDEPYHYIRLYNDGQDEILIVGGEDHRTGQDEEPEQHYDTLVKWTRERFTNAGEVKYKWSGQVLEPFDGLSYIGVDLESAGRIFISTGDSGMGMTHSAFSSIILDDLVNGRKNPWADLYDPKRITLKAAPEFIKEGLNTVIQYADYLTPPEVSTTEQIVPGTGAIMNIGSDKMAVYKDTNGKIFKYSAICPHLKCVVEWNKAERTWDCPCHGSRFDAKGNVINGPALKGLKAIE